jgi:hypothetical protein
MTVAALAAALTLAWAVRGQRIRIATIAIVLTAAAMALAYYAGPLRANFLVFKANLPSPATGVAVAIAAGLVAVGTARLRSKIGDRLARHLPLVLGVGLVLLAGFALFFRHRAGLLAEHDAASLRIYRDAYVYWPALIAALAGCVMVTRREFWRDPAFFIVFAAFAAFLFYKIRVVP